MFYRPEDGHGLPRNPLNAIITPRPIGWISSRSAGGVENIAPYSFFNLVAYEPPQLVFSSTEAKEDRAIGKDSVANIEETGVFCANIVEYAAREAMNLTSGSYPAEVDEFALAGIARAPCETIPCSRVAEAPANLECRLVDVVRLRGAHNYLVIGQVTGIHLRDDCIVEGRFDITRFQPLTRLGYADYARITEVFRLRRPGS